MKALLNSDHCTREDLQEKLSQMVDILNVAVESHKKSQAALNNDPIVEEQRLAAYEKAFDSIVAKQQQLVEAARKANKEAPSKGDC